MELDRKADASLTARQALGAVHDDGSRGVRARDAVGKDQRAGTGGKHEVHRPLREVLRDHRAESLGERRLGRHQRLFDVFARVLTRGKQNVIVGVIGPGALEDLEVDLLADLGLDGIAVSMGRGAFRGLRVGVRTAKGVAWALGVPVAAVPTLDAMAAAIPWAALPVCPVVEARRAEVYASLYRHDGDGLRREWEYLALPTDELAARLTEPTLLIGDGAAGITSPHARRPAPPRRVPSPACVAVLGRERLDRKSTRLN